jgi:hypothetical protein
MQRSGNTVVPLPEVNNKDRCLVDVFGGDSVFAQPPPDANPWYITAFPFLEGFAGELVFPEEFSTYTDSFTGLQHDVPCFDVRDTDIGCIKRKPPACNGGKISNPYLGDLAECLGDKCDEDTTDTCLAQVCPDNVVDHAGNSRCLQPCFEKCPNPAYPDSEYRMMWLAYVVPGTASFPINVWIVGGFILGGKKIHKGSRPAIKIAASLALLWATVAVLPSLFLYTDLVCIEHGYNQAKGSKLGCNALRGSIHILQCMYYWVALAVMDLHLAIVKEMTVHNRDQFLKKVGGFAFLVPLLMMIGSYTLQVRDETTLDSTTDTGDIVYPNRSWNNLKDVFTCTGIFQDILTETLLVYLHFVLAGMCIIVLLVQIVKKILTSTLKTGGGRLALTDLKGMQKLVAKSGAQKLIKLGTMSSILLLFNLLVIALSFPKFEQFDIQAEQYVSCQVTQSVAFNDDMCLTDNSCCDFVSPYVLGTAPNSIILALGYYFAIAAIPLTFGVIFGGDKKHMAAWKSLVKSSKVLSAASSAMSSTA